ncbi:LamG-like jellyroll fold domain-containing protein [Neotamlana nanhaiensis]|uniref:LamG-like jellyroll fold domain-containing protein n=1 Tax=Neotamlana nanhaiensis TaxID=1382798 RepID=UPI00069A622E|nr:LamG-like jellyroll fold domain-containing protein [Tamlana nanhaiensis]
MKPTINHKTTLTIFLMMISLMVYAQEPEEDFGSKRNLEWLVSDFLSAKFSDVQINGSPKTVDSPYGDAVFFDGIDDAIFLDFNALESFDEFTIEMIFNPAIDGPFEQRIVHIGEVSGDRMLLEIRTTDENWYFDGFVASKGNKLALIHEELLHPLGQWHHVAFVVSKTMLSTFVNGKLQLSEPYVFSSINQGKGSVGVRLNKRSYFKGSIYKIKISPKKLNPKSFMEF